LPLDNYDQLLEDLENLIKRIDSSKDEDLKSRAKTFLTTFVAFLKPFRELSEFFDKFVLPDGSWDVTFRSE